jgi:hypothetical protein
MPTLPAETMATAISATNPSDDVSVGTHSGISEPPPVVCVVCVCVDSVGNECVRMVRGYQSGLCYILDRPIDVRDDDRA